MSPDFFCELISKNCHYCNSPPKLANYLSSSTKRYGGFTANGIDRLDNKIGYTIENSVTCCKFCNMMKRNLTYDDFLNHICKIYNFNNK